MNRRSRAALVTAVAVVALGASAAAEARTYHGTVGPGRVITLTNARGARVARVPAGRHTFLIHDLSSTHNFVLARGGTIVRRTGVSAIGVFTWRRVRISRGTYSFYCATHRRQMHGSFRAA